MPHIVYTHPRGLAERVFLSGIGQFIHGVPQEVDAGLVGSLLGDIVDGAFSRNPLFSLVVPALSVEPEESEGSPFPPEEAEHNEAPTAHEGDQGQ